MARDKNADPLRRSGKHSPSIRQKYGHEHYEQIPPQRNHQKNVNGNKLKTGNKSHKIEKFQDGRTQKT